ncbi:hypothetical protein M9Y10_033663 [Tritrichomonas musculus]|uniref:Choline transporter-like protein n=1 Tax=Tritrichomonas musculus TaxID=1915356 RepID=A0ABR2KCS3_9EUKA
MLENDMLQPGQHPIERRVKTDTLFLYFSWPLFFAILQVFIFVISFGRTFSFIHPADSNGLRCGIDNSLLFSNLTDFKNNNYLSYKSKCISKCDGNPFLSYCIPTTRKKLRESPFFFKLVSDFRSYYSFSIFLIILTVVFSFPLSFICAKFAKFIVYTLILFVAITTTYFTYQSIRYKAYPILFDTLFFGLTYLLLLFYIKRRLNIISPLLTSSFKFLFKAKSILLAPLFLISLSLLVLLFTILGVLFTNGVVKYNVKSSILTQTYSLKTEQHSSLIMTKVLFIFLGIWMINFLFVLARMSISYITSAIYFNHHIPTFSESLSIILTYHSGTVFFGSFVCFMLEALSTFFAYLQKWLEKTKNSFVKFLLKCILNVCFILVRFVEEINRISFVYTAIEGVSFWDGCKKAANLFKIESILSIDVLMRNIFFGARIIVSSLAGIATYFYVRDMNLMNPHLAVIFVSLTVYFVLKTIDVVVSTTSQTLLVCMLEDAKDEGAYAPAEVKTIMVWLRERVGFNSNHA